MSYGEYILEAVNKVKRSTLPLAYKALTDYMGLRIIFPSLEGELSWAFLYEHVRKTGEEENWPHAESEKLINLLHSRKTREHVAKSFLTSEELKLFYKFENSSIDEIYAFVTQGKTTVFYGFGFRDIDDVRHVSNESSLAEFIKEAKLSVPKSWPALQDSVKYSKLSQHEKNALYSVLMFKGMYRKREKKNDGFEMFFTHVRFVGALSPVTF